MGGRLTVVGALIFFVATYDSRPDVAEIALEVALVPPAIIFIVGWLLFWAFKGFSRKR
jgi:hypothetical protein